MYLINCWDLFSANFSMTLLEYTKNAVIDVDKWRLLLPKSVATEEDEFWNYYNNRWEKLWGRHKVTPRELCRRLRCG